MSNVKVSVVVPWSGQNIELLERQLESLDVQTYSQPFEVILSCNSKPAIAQFQSLQAVPNFFRLVDSSAVPGVVYSRNQAAKYALADKVLFCDADDIVADNWVEEMAGLLDIFDLVGSPLDFNSLNSFRFNSRSAHSQERLPVALNFLPYAPGCSQGYRKKVLDSIGGFNSEAQFTEDIDISWRLQLAGHSLGFASKTHVQYRLESKFLPAFSKHFNYGVGFAALAKMYQPYGARQSWKDTFVDLAKCLGSIVLFFPQPGKRCKSGFICGFFAGRLSGSFKYGVKAV